MHALRHTHASVLLYKKIDFNYISERFGHSNINTTYKHYSHVIKELREEEEKQTIETFENM
ncbi:tyrosine-type recombinase/integrase [Metabacillus niabensis]|uniref:tyrosine-type recombinase/integrase n=1 Tax=Metabacillus niabensis TaxID=324854 RepID=UPI001F35D8AD|nr:tyrosine-type recombinase/integrase [Metabacillus niabensis]